MHYRKPVGETAFARSVFNSFPSSLLVILQPDFSRERNFKPRSMLLIEVFRREEKIIIFDSHVSEIDCRIHLSEDSNLS